MRTVFLAAVLCLESVLSLGNGVITPFDLCPSPEALGFAGAFCALAQGPSALIFNPAGLSLGGGEEAATAFYLRPNGKDELMTAFWIGGSAGPLAVGFTGYSPGDPRPEGPVPHLGASLGMGIWEGDLGSVDLSLGASVRYLQAEFQGYLGSGLALCFGALGSIDLGEVELRLAASVEDIGFGITFVDLGRTFPWTTDVRLGFALVGPRARVAADYYGGDVLLGLGVWVSEGIELRLGVSLEGRDAAVSLGLGAGWEEFRIDSSLDREKFSLGFGIAF